MRFQRVLLCAAVVATSGCAKSMSTEPTSDRDAATASGDVRRHPPDGRESRTTLQIVGTIVTLRDGRPRVHRNVLFEVPEIPLPEGPASGLAPRDTVPAYSTIKSIRWSHGGDGRSDLDALHARMPSDAPIDSVLSPGIKRITVHAGDDSARFFFQVGFTPQAWWAGPDPDRWPASSDGDGRAVDVIDWSRFLTVPAWPPDGRTYFGPDSFGTIPSARRPPGGDFARKTFYEIFGDRIYA